ncbi:MAG TPA: biotin/lipoyl-binding protein [Acidimicrobiales bacterium]|nr:biotin/lipoyl-binding protein [Acidimicrobiales bacterium]
MTRRSRRPRSKIKLLVAVVIVAAVAVGGTLGGLALTSSSAPQYVAVPATLGTVSQTTSLTGTIEPVTQADLNFSTAGTVASVPVKVGETVKTGEVLATLETSDLRSQVDQSEASLDSAESSLATARSPASSVTATAQQTVSSDRTTLANDEATMGEDVTTDELSLTSAQGAVSSAQDVDASAAELQSNDQSTLEAAQSKEEIDCAGDGVATAVCSSDETTVSGDQKQLSQDDASMSGAASTVQSAETSLTETQLKNMQTSRQDGQKVAADKAQLEKDLTALSDAKDGLYADQVDADEMAVDSAKNAVASAEQNLADANLVSPIEGLVTAVNVAAGDSAQAGSSTDGSSSNSSSASSPAFEIESPSTFDVDATASSRQISELMVGDQVLIVPTGATAPSLGTVVSISTIPTISSGVATFPIVIGVTGKPTDMYVGATADLTATVLDVKNVLTVPTSAVHTFGRSSFVNVLANGKEVKRPVVVGAVGGVLTQIKSGITAGQKVVVGNLGASLPGSHSSSNGAGQHIQFTGPGGSGIVTKRAP